MVILHDKQGQKEQRKNPYCFFTESYTNLKIELIPFYEGKLQIKLCF